MAIPKKLFNLTWSELSDKQKKNIGVSKSEFIRQKKAHNKSSSTAKSTPTPTPTPAPKPTPKPTPTPSKPKPKPMPKPKAAAILAINEDKGKLKPNDVKQISKDTGLSEERIVKLATNSPKVEDKKVSKGALRILEPASNSNSNSNSGLFSEVGDTLGKNEAQEIAEQTGKSLETIAQKAEEQGIAIGTGTQRLVEQESSETGTGSGTGSEVRDPDDVGNLKRISQDNFGTSEADDAGIIYKTYDEKGGGILKIGNMPGHRTEDSPYKDIKIIDYDATIANYDPAKSLKGMKVIKSVDDKGNVTFKTPKIKRITDDKGEEITGDTFRTEKRKKDYAERGLKEGGGKITKFKIGGEYKKIKTNKDGTLKRLTLTSGGKYKETNSSFPAKLKTDSFSDLLKTKTGLKFNSGPGKKKRLKQIGESLDAKPAKFSSDSRDKYIRQGRKSLNDKDLTT